jgi:hypothetical protein
MNLIIQKALSVLGVTVKQGARGQGTQAVVTFLNGYQASIINDGYGSADGRYELAVMSNGELDYTTPITSDVLGHLTEQDVLNTCTAIAALPTLDK